MVAPPSLQFGHTVNIRHADISSRPWESPSRDEGDNGGRRLDDGSSIVLQEQREATGALAQSLSGRAAGRSAKQCEYTAAPPGLCAYDDWRPYDAIRLAPPTHHPFLLPPVVNVTHDTRNNFSPQAAKGGARFDCISIQLERGEQPKIPKSLLPEKISLR